MLVWEILLGTERAQKGASPRRAPPPHTPPETLAVKGVFSESGGQNVFPVPFQAE